ncbi:hypothetical protein ACHAWO_005893 [Cyclotella atomus]|uniref:Cyclin N-terminal domain-containing protein n=1 Tax=Cyclotella atomus TaxID=382360 RepID=A0ABD3MS79_9STRA
MSLPQHLQLSSNEYLLDHIITMRNQEKTSYKVSRDYFHDGVNGRMSSTGFMVSPSERKTMLSWAYDIVDVCKIERHVAITAVSYLDRFLADNVGSCAHALSSRRNYQLCFIVCLIIALKNCAGMKVESDFVTNVLCHGLYQEKEILDMEMIVLQGLGWLVNGPTAIDFVHAFLKLLPNQDDCQLKALVKTAEVQVELAMGDFSVAIQEPSSIACSSIILAMNSLGGKYYSGVEVNAVDRFVWMHSVAMSAGIDIERLMMKMAQSRLMDSNSDLVTCSDSSESSEGSSPRTSVCGVDHFNASYSVDGSMTTYTYYSRNTQ